MCLYLLGRRDSQPSAVPVACFYVVFDDFILMLFLSRNIFVCTHFCGVKRVKKTTATVGLINFNVCKYVSVASYAQIYSHSKYKTEEDK